MSDIREMADVRELDPVELASVEGGYNDEPTCGFHPLGWHPPTLS
jgi:hypothetical protein